MTISSSAHGLILFNSWVAKLHQFPMTLYTHTATSTSAPFQQNTSPRNPTRSSNNRTSKTGVPPLCDVTGWRLGAANRSWGLAGPRSFRVTLNRREGGDAVWFRKFVLQREKKGQVRGEECQLRNSGAQRVQSKERLNGSVLSLIKYSSWQLRR